MPGAGIKARTRFRRSAGMAIITTETKGTMGATSSMVRAPSSVARRRRTRTRPCRRRRGRSSVLPAVLPPSGASRRQSQRPAHHLYRRKAGDAGERAEGDLRDGLTTSREARPSWDRGRPARKSARDARAVPGGAAPRDEEKAFRPSNRHHFRRPGGRRSGAQLPAQVKINLVGSIKINSNLAEEVSSSLAFESTRRHFAGVLV